jgi:hypothetical protein
MARDASGSLIRRAYKDFRIIVAGAVVLMAGSMMIVGVTVEALTAPAFADTSAFELFCTNSPIGNLVFNDVVISGTLSPASPSPGEQFSLENFQEQVAIPAGVVQEASVLGNTISGTTTATLAATGATPSSTPTGSLAFSEAIPSPVPSSGGTLDAPTTPTTIGPFTANSSDVSLALGSSITLTITELGTSSPIECSAYPNDVLPSGSTEGIPPGLPISPVIAFAGSTPPPPPTNALTGPYELYCPHTPVGDLVFNDVTTSATITPSTLSAGEQFQVTGYQTDIPVPSGVVSAAVGLGNSSFDGLAASDVDAYGATPSQAATGSMGFDLPIPNPVPSSALALDIPSSPTTVGPFSASGGPITIAQDQSILVVAELSSKAFKMSCTAYPNDTIATSGSTGTPPPGTPIRPIIATTSASGTPVTTTTTIPAAPGTANQTPGAPYELYCPGTPIGDIAVNDVVTTGAISPTSLNEGDQFEVTGLQTQFTIPQNVAEQAENLGLTTLSGDLLLFVDVTGTEYGGTYPGTSVGVASGTTAVTTSPGSPPTTTLQGVSPAPLPGPFPTPGEEDLSFDTTLPSPVPSTGVQFTATPAPGSEPETFVAAGGPIQVSAAGANLNVSAFGDQFGLFCDTLANDTVPTGLSVQEPNNGFIEPLITTGSATIVPPPPGAPGPYELFCPGTPVGDIVLNEVNTTGTITPPDPTPGEQFNLTGYQTTLDVPSNIASAAAALGNTDLSGTATGSVDASGAMPAQISTGAMSFDVPLPSPIPVNGVTLTLSPPAGTVGPFTASGGVITIAEDAAIQLVLTVAGTDLTLQCSAYANGSEPPGIVTSSPLGSPTSPVIATTASNVPATAATTSGSTLSESTTTHPVATNTASSTINSAGSGSASTVASPVEASSSSLAFTGPGAWTGWLVVAGAALIVLGLAMLVLADAPRRLRWALHERAGGTGTEAFGTGAQCRQR